MNPQDIVLYFMDSLQHHDLIKVVTVNSKTDTIKKVNVDWLNEMDFLESININKPAYKGTIKIDTLHIADTLVYNLSCSDNKLNVKYASMHYFRDQLMHMTVSASGSNFLFSNTKEIYFNPRKGYIIKGVQKLDLVSKQPIEYRICVNKL